MIPVLGARAGVKGSQIASNAASAMKNDLYVRRWSTVTGKGKQKKVVDHELHINPVGVAVGAIGVAVGAGLAGLAGALALRYSGKKVVSGEVSKRFMVDEFDAVYEDQLIVDSPAIAGWTEVVVDQAGTPESWSEPPIWVPETRIWVEGSYIHGTWQEGHWDVIPGHWSQGGVYTPSTPQVTHSVWHPPVDAVTHTAHVLITPGTAILLTKRGIPLGVFEGGDTTADAIRMAMKRSTGAVDGSVTLNRTARIIATHPKSRKRVWCNRYYYQFKAKGISLEDKEEDSSGFLDWLKPFG